MNNISKDEINQFMENLFKSDNSNIFDKAFSSYVKTFNTVIENGFSFRKDLEERLYSISHRDNLAELMDKSHLKLCYYKFDSNKNFLYLIPRLECKRYISRRIYTPFYINFDYNLFGGNLEFYTKGNLLGFYKIFDNMAYGDTALQVMQLNRRSKEIFGK